METAKRKIVEASVYSYGIRGRDRKVKMHRHKLGDFEPDAVDRAALLTEARAWIESLRQPSKASLSLQPMEIEIGPVFTTRTFMMYSGESIPI